MPCPRLCGIASLLLKNARDAASLTIVLSLLPLGAVAVAQYGFGLQPCELCIFQRIPYAFSLVLGLTALLLARKYGSHKKAAFLIFLCGIAWGVGCGFAVYHVGVEHHWWESFLEACHVSFASGKDLTAQIEAARAVPCDVPAWSFLGITMAGFNAIYALFIALYAIAASIQITRRANGF